jgi:hypothetical protein
MVSADPRVRERDFSRNSRETKLPPLIADGVGLTVGWLAASGQKCPVNEGLDTRTHIALVRLAPELRETALDAAEDDDVRQGVKHRGLRFRAGPALDRVLV